MTLDSFIVISQHITEALLNKITKREEHKKKKRITKTEPG